MGGDARLDERAALRDLGQAVMIERFDRAEQPLIGVEGCPDLGVPHPQNRGGDIAKDAPRLAVGRGDRAIDLHETPPCLADASVGDPHRRWARPRDATARQ